LWIPLNLTRFGKSTRFRQALLLLGASNPISRSTPIAESLGAADARDVVTGGLKFWNVWSVQRLQRDT
jgi:hypothetical protein